VDLDQKIDRALELAIELGDVGAAKVKLRALRADRDRVAGELAQVSMDLPSAESLIPRLRENLRDISAALKADPTLGRMALGSLLGDSRLRVYADGRIEGLATLDPRNSRGPEVSLRAATVGGSGGALRPCPVEVSLDRMTPQCAANAWRTQESPTPRNMSSRSRRGAARNGIRRHPTRQTAPPGTAPVQIASEPCPLVRAGVRFSDRPEIERDPRRHTAA